MRRRSGCAGPLDRLNRRPGAERNARWRAPVGGPARPASAQDGQEREAEGARRPLLAALSSVAVSASGRAASARRRLPSAAASPSAASDSAVAVGAGVAVGVGVAVAVGVAVGAGATATWTVAVEVSPEGSAMA